LFQVIVIHYHDLKEHLVIAVFCYMFHHVLFKVMTGWVKNWYRVCCGYCDTWHFMVCSI